MQYSRLTNNLIQTAKSVSASTDKKYILYDENNSAFDLILQECSDINLIPFNISDYHKAVYGYNLFWNNSPLSYSDYDEFVSFQHLKSVVFFHDSPDTNFKKEDKFILNNSLKNSVNICPSSNIQKSWGLSSAMNIQYGIPDIDLNIDRNNKNSVILINTSNNHKVNLLAKYIKQYFTDTEVLTKDENTNWASFSDKLQQYKLCIVFNNQIDVLASVACGCLTVSPIPVENNGVINVTDFSNIIDTIKDALLSYNANKSIEYSKNVLSEYSFTNFNNQINTILNQIIREPFLL